MFTILINIFIFLYVKNKLKPDFLFEEDIEERDFQFIWPINY